MDPIALILTVFFILLIVILLGLTIKIIPQSHAYVIERLGAYSHTLPKGLHMIFPLVDRVALDVPLKEQVYDFPPQPVITKDNVTMMIDTIVFFQILDPKLFAYGVQNPIKAIEALSATTLRNIIGDLELDDTLTSREVINTKMRVNFQDGIARYGWNTPIQSVHPGGAFMLRCDGGAVFVSSTIGFDVLKYLCVRDDGQSVSID